MRIVLADLKGRSGFVSKDTVAGGYGSRLRPFSKVTDVYCFLKRRFHDVPSVHMAYLAAIADRAGHDVAYTREEQVDGDVALVLSSLVDHKQETSWADDARKRGVRVGFVGLAASKMPQLFEDHADFLVQGEPEAAVMRLVAGEHARRESHQRGAAGSRRPAVPALGPAQRPALALPRAGLRPADRRRFPRARQQRMSRVLHLLPASDSCRLSHAVSGQPSRRARLSL